MNRNNPWSKATISRFFLGGALGVVVGAVLVLAAVWAAVASNFVVTAALVVVGSVVLIAGTVAAVASWVGALFNTARLEDKTWLTALLLLALFGCGVLAMAAYVYAGPDGTATDATVGPGFARQEAGLQ